MITSQQDRVWSRTAARSPQRACLYLSVAAFWIALVTPALYLEKNQFQGQGLGGWQAGAHPFVIGWLGIFCRQFGWYANIPLFAGWSMLYHDRRRLAGICGLIALVVSSHTFDLFRTGIPGEQTADKEMLKQLGCGFYLWVLSMLLVLIGAVLGKTVGSRDRVVDGSGDP